MAWLKRETPYERRIRELEEEADRVRKSMQQLMRQVPPDAGHMAASTGSPRKSLRTTRPVFRSSATPPGLVKEPVAAPPEPNENGDEAIEKVFTAETTGHKESATPVNRPEKMAHYLSSGSFGKGYSHARERRIQRNKAIMMLVFALIALYSLYMWLK